MVAPKKTRAAAVAYSPELVEKVCELLASGKSLRDIGKMKGMPDRSTLWRWTQSHPEIEQPIARARAQGFDELADRAMEEACTASDPVKGRLALDARRWYLAKLNPARYGERQLVQSQISGPDGGPIQIDSEISDAEALRRLEEIFSAAEERQRLALEYQRRAAKGEAEDLA